MALVEGYPADIDGGWGYVGTPVVVAEAGVGTPLGYDEDMYSSFVYW